jgi:hypothetical protein
MAEEYEHDPGVPTEDDVDQCYGSKFLGVTDVGNKKIRTKITKVRKEEVNDHKTGRPKKRFIAYLESLDKPWVLNNTNIDTLIDVLGKAPAGWEGATVGIKVDPDVKFGGKRTGGVRLAVLYPPAAKTQPAPKPAPTPAAIRPAAEWPEQEGDPGFESGAAKDFEPTNN